jgi:putative ABC transport system permease protein
VILVRLARNVKLGVKTLLVHKLRSLLTMLGVVFGVSSVIAMLAVGEGASAEAKRRIELLGARNIIIESIKPADQQNSNERVSIYGLLYDDAERIAASFDHVERVVPVKALRREGRLGTRTAELRVVATTPDWFELVQRDIITGQRLAPRHAETQSSVVVLTQFGRDKLLAGEEVIGNRVMISGSPYEVIGVVDAAAGGGDGAGNTPDDPTDAYIPLPLARARFGDLNVTRSSGSFMREQVELHAVLVEVDDIANVESVAAGIRNVLQRFHPDGDYRLTVPLDLIREAERTQRTWNQVLGSIAGISLLVGGIGIMNIMLASVTERTREIGIRRAIGARKPQIVGQFLIETVVLSAVGGLIGIGLGVLIPWVIENNVDDMPTRVTNWSILLAAGISVIVGIVFGIYPAARAANLDPIDALRHE